MKNNFNSHKCKLKDISEYKNIIYNLQEELALKNKKNTELEDENKEKLSIAFQKIQKIKIYY